MPDRQWGGGSGKGIAEDEDSECSASFTVSRREVENLQHLRECTNSAGIGAWRVVSSRIS